MPYRRKSHVGWTAYNSESLPRYQFTRKQLIIKEFFLNNVVIGAFREPSICVPATLSHNCIWIKSIQSMRDVRRGGMADWTVDTAFI
jgi:hypothetical protein